SRMYGIYWFADFYRSQAWGAVRQGTNWVVQDFALPIQFTATFGEDEAGEIYLVNLVFGRVYHLEDTGLVIAPVFNPAGGTVATDQILVTSLSPGAAIHYTTNGATPTESDPVVGT